MIHPFPSVLIVLSGPVVSHPSVFACYPHVNSILMNLGNHRHLALLFFAKLPVALMGLFKLSSQNCIVPYMCLQKEGGWATCGAGTVYHASGTTKCGQIAEGK